MVDIFRIKLYDRIMNCRKGRIIKIGKKYIS